MALIECNIREAWSFANNVRSFMKEGNRMKYVRRFDIGNGRVVLMKKSES